MERDYTFFWQGLSQDELRQYDVGFAVRNSLDCHHRNPLQRVNENSCPSHKNISGLCEHHIRLRPDSDLHPRSQGSILRGSAGKHYPEIPSSEGIYLLGDFNTHVGTDWQAWPTCLGHFGIGRMNENGQRLLNLCCHHGLCITNSYFRCKELHKVSWRHPLRIITNSPPHAHTLFVFLQMQKLLPSPLSSRTRD